MAEWCKTEWQKDINTTLTCVQSYTPWLPHTEQVGTTSAVCVNDPVPLQMVHQDEGFSTQCAAIRPLPAVCALVDPQAALLREPLPTLSTTVWLLARVRPVVDAEVGRTLEVFATHRAPESPLSLVALVVQLELVKTAKCLPALRADIAPCHSRQRFVCWETPWSESSVRW